MRPEIARYRKRHAIARIAAHAFDPGLLNRNRIAADLDDLSVCRFEFFVICAEPAHLVQSPAGEAGRMKTDYNILTVQIGKRDLAGMAVQGEIGSLCAGFKCHMT